MHHNFIDFGRAHEAVGKNEYDIVSMLLKFYTPAKERTNNDSNWIFGDWLEEYAFSYSRPKLDSEEKKYYLKKRTIHIYLNPEDINPEGAYPIIHYAVLDPYGVFHEGSLNLSEVGLDSIVPEVSDPSWICLEKEQEEPLEKKILEITNCNGYTLSQENRNETLFNLLKDPRAFFGTTDVPTALDITVIRNIGSS